MFHNWIEMRAYMVDRQRELLREAEEARRAAVSRESRRALRKKRHEERNATVIQPEIQDGGAC
jgi:hypothetical protein